MRLRYAGLTSIEIASRSCEIDSPWIRSFRTAISTELMLMQALYQLS